jgi:ribosome biogenesis GTPase A
MSINWYPGHMHKAGKEIKQALPKVDLVIEVLDARIPFSSENPMLARLRGNKPCIKIFNKNDLADPKITKLWQTHLEQHNHIKTLALSSHYPDKIRQIPDLCRKLLPEKKDSIKQIRTMIMGIPNVGKSTLINILVGRSIAKTGNEPAVTKRQQRINLADDIVLFDTPGMLWPKLTTRQVGYRLAITGAIKNTAIDHADVAFFAAQYLLQHYPENLQSRYQLEQLPDTELELLETIGKQRGCLGARGLVDLDKVAKILLSEFRAGTLGTISLELPHLVEQELAEQAIIDEKKAEKKAARSKKHKNTKQSSSNS